jgi:hypothetical protein
MLQMGTDWKKKERIEKEKKKKKGVLLFSWSDILGFPLAHH